jgi:hypothetical protein
MAPGSVAALLLMHRLYIVANIELAKLELYTPRIV